jgi:hypothetical protein
MQDMLKNAAKEQPDMRFSECKVTKVFLKTKKNYDKRQQ